MLHIFPTSRYAMKVFICSLVKVNMQDTWFVAAYRSGVVIHAGNDLIMQSQLSLTVVQPTSPSRITAIAPKSVTSAFQVVITLTGTVAQGDVLV